MHTRYRTFNTLTDCLVHKDTSSMKCTFFFSYSNTQVHVHITLSIAPAVKHVQRSIGDKNTFKCNPQPNYYSTQHNQSLHEAGMKVRIMHSPLFIGDQIRHEEMSQTAQFKDMSYTAQFKLLSLMK